MPAVCEHVTFSFFIICTQLLIVNLQSFKPQSRAVQPRSRTAHKQNRLRNVQVTYHLSTTTMPNARKYHNQMPAYLLLPPTWLNPQVLQANLENFNARANDLNTTYNNLRSTFLTIQSRFAVERSGIPFKEANDLTGAFSQDQRRWLKNQRTRRARWRLMGMFRAVESAQSVAWKAMERGVYGQAAGNLSMGEDAMGRATAMLSALTRSVEKYTAARDANAGVDAGAATAEDEQPGEVQADDADDGGVRIPGKPHSRPELRFESLAGMQSDGSQDEEGDITRIIERHEAKGEHHRRWSWVV